MRRSVSLATLALASFALAGVACSKLTSPPAPEPIGSDTPLTMATAREPHPQGTATARPRRDRPGREHPGAEATVKIQDLVVGKGPEVKAGDIVVVHYTGTLLDGTKFDSSHDHPGGQPFTTPIPGRLIKGWNEGIPGMRVGGKRRLVIPPELGYGPMPQAKIPANSTLVFDIELLEIKSNPHARPLPKGP
jgi:peptidylprolyl isomerase